MDGIGIKRAVGVYVGTIVLVVAMLVALSFLFEIADSPGWLVPFVAAMMVGMDLRQRRGDRPTASALWKLAGVLTLAQIVISVLTLPLHSEELATLVARMEADGLPANAILGTVVAVLLVLYLLIHLWALGLGVWAAERTTRESRSIRSSA